MFQHIIRPGMFLEGATGPAVLQENIQIKLATNRRSHTIEENTTVEQEQAIGLFVTAPGVIIEPGFTQISEAVFATAYLRLRIRSTVVIDRLYLSTIRAFNEEGRSYPLFLADQIDFSRSELVTENSSDITPAMLCQFQVEYLTRKGA